MTTYGPWIQPDDQWSNWSDLRNQGWTSRRQIDVDQYGNLTSAPRGGGNYSSAASFLAAELGRSSLVSGAYMHAEIIVPIDLSQLNLNNTEPTYPPGAIDIEYEADYGTMLGPVVVELTPMFSPYSPDTDTPADDHIITARLITDLSLLQVYESRWWAPQAAADAPDDFWLDTSVIAGLPEVTSWRVGDGSVTRAFTLDLSDFADPGVSTQSPDSPARGLYPLIVIPTWALPGGAAAPTADQAYKFSLMTVQGDTYWGNGTAQQRVWMRPARYRFIFSDPAASLIVDPASGGAPLEVEATYLVTANGFTVTGVSLDWGDGNATDLTGLSGTVSHTYASAGEFNATLSVTTDATTYGGWSHPDPEVVVGQVPDSYPNGDNAVERRDEHNTVTSKTNASAFYDLASRVNGWAASWDFNEGTINGNHDIRPSNTLGVDYDRSSAFLVTAGYHLILTAILAPPAPSGIWEITTVNGEEIDRQDMVPAPVGETIYRDLLPPLISAPLGNTLLFETEARCDPRVDPLPPSDEVSFTVSWTLDVTWRPPMYRWIYPADPITASQLVDVTDPLLAPVGGVGTDTAARGGFRVRLDPPLPDSAELALRLGRPVTLGDLLIPQNSTRLVKSPHVIAGGRVMPPPGLAAASKSMCRAVDWVVEPDLRGLEELGQMGAVARWIPDESDFSGLTWNPHWGSGMSIALTADYTPYVDPEYVYYARHVKQVTTPAVIFNGAGWARLAGSGLNGIEGFTVVLVATVHHPNNNSMADIFASPSGATDPSRATDCTLRYDNGHIRSHLGARTSSYRPSLFSHRGRIRPIIIVWAGGPRRGLLGIYDHVGGNGHWHEYAHPNHPGYDARLWFGMNGAVQDQNYAQPMDVFDVSFYSHRMTLTEAKRTAHKLDGVYGVTGR